MVKRCCVKKCKCGSFKDREIRKLLNVKQGSLFSPPKDPTLLAQWAAALKINLSAKHYICDGHFKDEDIVKSVRHDFPDGTHQIILRERWSLIPNAIPSNTKPREYCKFTDNIVDLQSHIASQLQPDDKEFLLSPAFVEVPESLPQLNDLKPIVTEFQVIDQNPLLISNSSDQLKIEKNYLEHPKAVLQIKPINELLEQKEAFPINKHEGDIKTEEITIAKDSNQGFTTLKGIRAFINVPPAWYYIVKENEIMFVYIDSVNLNEKLRLYINEDMSVMISFLNKKKVDCNLKISNPSELSSLFTKWEQTPICCGTGIKDRSISSKCNGVVENYKRRRPNPRCIACRNMRNRLLNIDPIIANKQIRAEIKTSTLQKELRSYKNKYLRALKKIKRLKEKKKGGNAQNNTKNQEEQERAQQDAKHSILTQILDQSARARLNTLMLGKPEKGRMVENLLLNMARTGQVRGKISETELIGLLENVNQQLGTTTTKVKFDRRRAALDSDEDDL